MRVEDITLSKEDLEDGDYELLIRQWDTLRAQARDLRVDREALRDQIDDLQAAHVSAERTKEKAEQYSSRLEAQLSKEVARAAMYERRLALLALRMVDLGLLEMLDNIEQHS